MSLDENKRIAVSDFLAGISELTDVEVIFGKKSCDGKWITSSRVQKLGLALATDSHRIYKGQIQIIGESEVFYFKHLNVEDQNRALGHIDSAKISCIFIAKSVELPEKLTQFFQKCEIPIIRTRLSSSDAKQLASRFLERELAEDIVLHGVMLGMFGYGVLLLGESGIGKSECALDLITKGHSLISDDSVVIKKAHENLEASSPKITREHLEIRGLGIINVRELFGVSAIEKRRSVDLCITLLKWKDTVDIDRLGLEMDEEVILGVSVPKFVLPVSSGRHLSTLAETAVRVFLSRVEGHDVSKTLIEKHAKAVRGGT